MKSRLHGGWKGAVYNGAVRRHVQRAAAALVRALRLAPAGVLHESDRTPIMRILKAHAYGNDFLYVRTRGAPAAASRAGPRDVRSPYRHRRRRLIVYERDGRRRDDAAVQRRRQPGGGVRQRRARAWRRCCCSERTGQQQRDDSDRRRRQTGSRPGPAGQPADISARAMGLPAGLRQVRSTRPAEKRARSWS